MRRWPTHWCSLSPERAAEGSHSGYPCTTLCAGCADTGTLPRIASWTEAIHAVAEHCGHLGCDVDEMAAAMEEGAR